MAFPTGWTLLEQIDIDITSLSLSGALTNYPINIVTLTSETFAKLESDGKDLRFTSDEAGTTELPFEIVSINTAGETIQCWVKISSLSATTTTVYVWGNNPSATAYAASDTYGSQNVWKSEYRAVYHLEESGNGTVGEYIDSTANGNDGRGGNGNGTKVPSQVVGTIGNAQSFDGTDDFIAVPDDNSLDITSNLTIQAIIKPSTTINSGSGYLRVMDKNEAYALQFESGDGGLRLYSPSGEVVKTIQKSWVSGTTYHIHATHDTVGRMYVDGTQDNSNANTYTHTANANILTIGSTDTNTQPFLGMIDELRVLSEVLSADWIKTDYNLQNDPSTYITNTAIEAAGGTGMFLVF